jgi:hypothetical protein
MAGGLVIIPTRKYAARSRRAGEPRECSATTVGGCCGRQRSARRCRGAAVADESGAANDGAGRGTNVAPCHVPPLIRHVIHLDPVAL